MPTQLLNPSTESRDVELLAPELQDKVQLLRERCESRGLVLGVGTTVRGPEAQARLWCRSRTPEDVARRHDLLVRIAPTLAGLLRPEWAAIGPQATVHLPGQSWHQWGQALDVYVDVGGKAVWEGSVAMAVAKLAKEVGLEHSYSRKEWEPKSRHWHAQLSRLETPLMVRGLVDSWADLEQVMLERFEL